MKKILLIVSVMITLMVNISVHAQDTRHRVIVSSDIGGTDPDDFQTMVYCLLHADTLAIEGLISSPFGLGRKTHILQVIDAYELDYPNLKTYSGKYPHPDSLRKITKEGALETPGPVGVSISTEGSDLIVQCARRSDSRPLHVLIWGGIEDLAQALYDAPDILPKLRVYFIGGPNKKWSVDAYQYIATHYKDLWIIEDNATYRGWFTGGNQTGGWNNTTFVSNNIAGHCALGNFFITKGGSTLKAGDSPSLARLLYGNPDDPSLDSWGGRFVRAWDRPHKISKRLTVTSDSLEQFGVLEMILPLGAGATASDTASMIIENQSLVGLVNSTLDSVKFYFSPKDAKVYSYTIKSSRVSLNNTTGNLTTYIPPPIRESQPASDLANWWTDDPSTDVLEGVYIGGKTINIWRQQFLQDFIDRMNRCQAPLAITNATLNQNILVYPTYVKDLVTISNLNSNDITYVELYDMTGKSVKKFTLMPGSINSQIDMNDVFPGMYLMRIINSSVDINKVLVKAPQ